VDPTTGIGAVFAAFGLAGAAGLNAWIPLIGLALAGRFGGLDLPEDYDALESTPALAALGACFAVDFVGDKIPAMDHLLHAAGSVVQPVAGAILFAAQTGVAGDVDPAVAIVLGAITSGGVHAGRATLRPFATVGTAGLANPFLSLAEDGGSLTLTGIAFLVPVLAVVSVIAIVVAAVLLWRRARRRIARR
jgi:hypothetical protein